MSEIVTNSLYVMERQGYSTYNILKLNTYYQYYQKIAICDDLDHAKHILKSLLEEK